jgi:ParB family chromosome partitioning protein
MTVIDIPVSDVDVSEENVRKNLSDGETDGGIGDLANAIERQGLLSPITVYRKPDGRYALVAGQRRLLAMKQLGKPQIAAIVRDTMDPGEAIAISLVENVHRADMNPRDKAVAFKALLSQLGTVQAVVKETGVGASTIKKYLLLLNLAPELQQKLAAGETQSTAALARLAQTISDPKQQLHVYDRIGGFTQSVQEGILKNVDPGLSNLDDLIEQATEGAFDVRMIKNCPWDCPTIPEDLKTQVEALLKGHSGGPSLN